MLQYEKQFLASIFYQPDNAKDALHGCVSSSVFKNSMESVVFNKRTSSKHAVRFSAKRNTLSLSFLILTTTTSYLNNLTILTIILKYEPKENPKLYVFRIGNNFL